MTELDSLWGCVWRGEAPPEALADWLLTHLPDEGELKASYLYLNQDGWEPDWAYLTVSWLDATRSHIFLKLEVRNLGMGGSTCFAPDQFANEFIEWLTEQIDFVYYVLSK